MLTQGTPAPRPASDPRGKLGYAQITGNQSGITTQTDITGLSVTVTVGSGRRIKITAYTPQFAQAGGIATDQYEIYIMEGATQLGGEIVLGGNGGTAFAIVTPTAGSHTYKVQGSHVTGSNAGVWGASSATPSFILVEDIGV